MRKVLSYGLMVFSAFFWSCEEEKEDLPSVEERTEAATSDLREKLAEPNLGWKLDYRPVNGSGSYFMILDFEENGSVSVQSDLTANNGEFYDQTITYRIDVALNIELIFENYVAFHYLFEYQQASFGGEFEFLYQGEVDGNLVFVSKSDFGNRTVITLEPATQSDLNAFSRDVASNFQKFAGQSPRLFGGVPPTQQLYFPDENISLFWSVDLITRNVNVDIAGIGTTYTEVLGNGTKTDIDHFTGYKFQNGKLQLDESFTATVDGTSFTISEISLGTLSMTGDVLCPGDTEATPVYTGSEATLGPFTMTKSLFNSSGIGFTEQTDDFYSVNVLFVLDQDFNSLSETGSIAAGFPGALGFMMTYGYDSPDDDYPAYSVGIISENENEEVHYFLREFTPTSTDGNKVVVDLLDSYYYTGTPSPEEEASIEAITDEIFGGGGTVYAYDLAIEGITAFQFYNPCNGYEFVLVQ